MYPVFRPVFCRGDAEGFIKGILERHPYGMEFSGQLGGNFLVSAERFQPGFIHRARIIEYERLTYYQPDTGQFLFCPAQQCPVVVLIDFRRTVVSPLPEMPVVVHPDQDAQNIRLQVQAILLPAFGQLIDLVPADPAVVNTELMAGQVLKKRGSNDIGIPLTERPALVWQFPLFFPAGIGNGVALEQDDTPLCKTVSYTGCIAAGFVFTGSGQDREARHDSRAQPGFFKKISA